MPDKFDPYRESLVMESTTIWPEEYDNIEPREREKIAALLQKDPESCSHLEYIRVHTGFCRQITVTPDDFERVSAES